MLCNLRIAEHPKPPTPSDSQQHLLGVVVEDATALCTMLPLREFKQRYRTALALHQALPLTDRTLPLPLSTGSALCDAVLFEKIEATEQLHQAAHLARAWHLVKNATPAERNAVLAIAPFAHNDHKLLLAAHATERNALDEARAFLSTLPWTWRLQFPAAVLVPAEQHLSGWRRTLRFSLVEHLPYEHLRTLFREQLTQAPAAVLLRARKSVQNSAAKLRFRFEGEREKALHNLAFGDGTLAATMPSLEPIGTFVRAREALYREGPAALLRVLENAEHTIPLTVLLGLLGNAKLDLFSEATPCVDALRTQALRAATQTELLLRLQEWSPWLTAQQLETLLARVHPSHLEAGDQRSFFRFLRGYLRATPAIREQLCAPLLVPYLRRFGTIARQTLPGSTVHFVFRSGDAPLLSLLLYAALSSAGPTRLHMIEAEQARDVSDAFSFTAIEEKLTASPTELRTFLLEQLGVSHLEQAGFGAKLYRSAFEKIPSNETLVIDDMYLRNKELLALLHRFDLVLNLRTDPTQAPGEVCLRYETYTDDHARYLRSADPWDVGSDQGVLRFAEITAVLAQLERVAMSLESGLS